MRCQSPIDSCQSGNIARQMMNVYLTPNNKQMGLDNLEVGELGESFGIGVITDKPVDNPGHDGHSWYDG